MKGGFYVYGIYWKHPNGTAVYVDQSLSPDPVLYTKDQVLGQAKVIDVVTGISVQDSAFDYIVFIEPTKEEEHSHEQIV